MSKHRSVKEMLKNGSVFQAEDVANYAVMNNTDRDIDKARNVEDLINLLLDRESRLAPNQ